MEEIILSHLNQYNYDIRITHDARFMDQKVTPDVLCIISDCVLQYIKDDITKEFTANDIWESDYANENIKDIFNKPDTQEDTASSEYDKFFAQPLRMLWYSWVLKLRKQWKLNFFSVNRKDLLEYISFKERNALIFLNLYLEKVLRDSWIFFIFQDFFNNNDKWQFKLLKDGYIKFIIDNTPINTAVEVSRIFTKVLNPLCYMRKLHWTIKWSFSKDIILYDELMYNRKNRRDTEKDKSETRQDFEKRTNIISTSEIAFVKFTVEKAKRLIKERYWNISEVNDWDHWIATQVHHIFPKSDFPIIETYLENLILLTPNQHYTKAHPNNDTKYINKDFQYLCLLSKSDSVKDSVDIKKDWFYSKEDFVFVLNTWISPIKEFSIFQSFDEIKRKLAHEFNKIE